MLRVAVRGQADLCYEDACTSTPVKFSTVSNLFSSYWKSRPWIPEKV